MDANAASGFLSGGGEMGALIRAHNWTKTPVGPPEAWPQSLKTAVRLMLTTRHPMFIWWGDALTCFYNDAYSTAIGPDRHPSALGQPGRAVWAEIWDVIGPQIELVMAGRGATWHERQLIPITRGDKREDVWWTYGYSPIDDDAAPNGVGGVLVICRDVTADVRAEQGHADDAERLRRFFKEAPGFMALLRGPDHIFELTNTAYERLVGRNVLGKPVREALPEVAGQGYFELLDQVYSTGQPHTASRSPLTLAMGADGALSQRYMDFVYQPVRDALGAVAGIFVEGSDVTHSVLTEEALRANDVALQDLNASLERQVAERTADRNRLWQLSTDIMLVARFDGVMTAVNPAWTTILGWSEQELVGRSFFDLVHPDDLAITIEGVRVLAEGSPLRVCNNRCRHKDDGYRWIAWTAVSGEGFISAAGRDFTIEKKNTEALEQSEARVRSIFESSYQYQGLLTPDGILLDANPTSLAGIEARLEDVIGKPFWQTPWFTGTPGVPDQIQAAIPQVAAGQTIRQEIVANLPSGLRAFDFSMRPVFDKAGQIIAIVPEAMELTERRAAEEQLRQAQKMEAVGQLTGGLAHDFNNLLTGITGSLELIQTRLEQGRIADLKRYITVAQEASKRAAALTHRLLAFSRRQTLDPKPTDINHLVAGMGDLIQRTMGPEIAVDLVPTDGTWNTLVDPNQLENALLNLCINARDAMPDGGHLTIETANIALDPRSARQRDMEPGHYVSLCVSDDGAGMTPDSIARAFDPFYTTKPIGMGTGLGLSMVYGFVRQSGGQARIHSRINQGTTVRLYLPRHLGTDEAGEAMVAEPMAPLQQVGQGETVLVIDDEPTVRMLVVEVLEELGYTAIEAGEGASGLKVLRSSARIDLLITDVGLPGGMNGRQVADAGRVLRPDLKVLFITGYAENAVINHRHLDPGMQMLTKPFAMEALASRIRDIIATP